MIRLCSLSQAPVAVRILTRASTKAPDQFNPSSVTPQLIISPTPPRPQPVPPPSPSPHSSAPAPAHPYWQYSSPRRRHSKETPQRWSEARKTRKDRQLRWRGFGQNRWGCYWSDLTRWRGCRWRWLARRRCSRGRWWGSQGNYGGRGWL